MGGVKDTGDNRWGVGSGEHRWGVGAGEYRWWSGVQVSTGGE